VIDERYSVCGSGDPLTAKQRERIAIGESLGPGLGEADD
jgi:hypothetical protein